MSEQEKYDAVEMCAKIAQLSAKMADVASKGREVHFVNLAFKFRDISERFNALAHGLLDLERTVGEAGKEQDHE